MMSGIRGRDTRPEIILRRGLHRRGFRFQLHRCDLPGVPDLTFPRFQAVLFAHGCFWHGHDCHLFKWPQSRTTFWRDKIDGNRRRDEVTRGRLLGSGWRVGTVWECALKGRGRLPLAEVIEKCENWLRYGACELELRGIEARSPV